MGLVQKVQLSYFLLNYTRVHSNNLQANVSLDSIFISLHLNPLIFFDLFSTQHMFSHSAESFGSTKHK